MVDAYGSLESENATVVTSLSAHTAIHYKKVDEEQLGGEEGESSHVLMLRPELNCLHQEELALSKAMLDHYLVPPPKSGFF